MVKREARIDGSQKPSFIPQVCYAGRVVVKRFYRDLLSTTGFARSVVLLVPSVSSIDLRLKENPDIRLTILLQEMAARPTDKIGAGL